MNRPAKLVFELENLKKVTTDGGPDCTPFAPYEGRFEETETTLKGDDP